MKYNPVQTAQETPRVYMVRTHDEYIETMSYLDTCDLIHSFFLLDNLGACNDASGSLQGLNCYKW